MKEERTVNFDDPQQKRGFINWFGQVRGVVRVTLESARETRSVQQNRYWFGCFVTPFAEWLEEQSGERVRKIVAHAILKEMFLKETILNPATGELMEYTMESHNLPKARFGRLIDDAASFLARDCGIIVQDPSAYGIEHKWTSKPVRAA